MTSMLDVTAAIDAALCLLAYSLRRRAIGDATVLEQLTHALANVGRRLGWRQGLVPSKHKNKWQEIAFSTERRACKPAPSPRADGPLRRYTLVILLRLL